MIEVELQAAVEVLRRGELLAYPTETFYGLGVDIAQPKALAALYDWKGRDLGKAVSLLVSGRDQLKPLVSELTDNTLFLIEKYLPGPLTLVLQAGPRVPESLRSEGNWVGIRWSSHPVAQALVEGLGGPITTTSANPSGQASASGPADLARYFGGRVGLHWISGGDLPPSRGSTVVKVHPDRLELLRAGDIPFAALEKDWES